MKPLIESEANGQEKIVFETIIFSIFFMTVDNTVRHAHTISMYEQMNKLFFNDSSEQLICLPR